MLNPACNKDVFPGFVKPGGWVIYMSSLSGVGTGYITLNVTPFIARNQKTEESSDYPEVNNRAKGSVIQLIIHLFKTLCVKAELCIGQSYQIHLSFNCIYLLTTQRSYAGK